MVHANRGRARTGRHIADALDTTTATAAETAATPSILAHEGQRHFHLGVLREVHDHRQVHRAPALVQAVGARPQASREPGNVLHEEGGEVDQHAIAGLGPGLEAPQRRGREGVLHRLPLRGAVARRAEAIVGLGHEDPGTDPLEPDDARAGQLAPIDADVVRPEPGADPRGVQNIGVPLLGSPARSCRPRRPSTWAGNRPSAPWRRSSPRCRAARRHPPASAPPPCSPPAPSSSASASAWLIPNLFIARSPFRLWSSWEAELAPPPPPASSLHACCKGAAPPECGPAAATRPRRPLPSPRATPPRRVEDGERSECDAGVRLSG